MNLDHSKKKFTLIWLLGIGGWLSSYYLFFEWFKEHDWDFFGGWIEAFTLSDFSTGLHLDLTFVTFLMITLAITDRRTLGSKWSAAVILSLALSVSMSLAIYIVGKHKPRPS